jgi:signal transduction histidine kinase/ActR/RegA family two-component response regulator
MASGEFFRSVLESAPVGVVALRLDDAGDDSSLRIVYANPAASEMTGVDLRHAEGVKLVDAFPSVPAARMRSYAHVCRTQRPLSLGAIRFAREETARAFNVGAFAAPNRSVVIVFDRVEEPFFGDAAARSAQEALRVAHAELERRVAERTDELQMEIAERFRAEEALQRTEEQLRQAQKMEAIGRLAGGIAHDFNNVLSVVLSYCELMLEQVPVTSPWRADLEEVRRAGERAATLTQQLLAFSRQQVLQPRVLDLNGVVRDMRGMLQRLLGEDVELELRCAPGLEKVRVDPVQIEQVLLNLAVNARDAMPGGGKLTIGTDNVELDARFAGEHLGVSPGRHVLLAVSDTGVGMDRETRARIFEPFFTTKEKGKGTGLGLSTAFGIVKQSGGSIWAYSEPGRGATFKVYLPATRDAPASLPPPQPAFELKGSETVLIVEDEDQVRLLAAGILRKFGYRVLEARMAREAIAVATAEHGPVDLLLTDVVMPEMAGPVLAEKLVAMRPGLHVLFMSGHTGDAIVRHGLVEGGAAFLQKPFIPEVLARCVRKVLDDDA